MEFKQLEAFVAVVEYNSFTEAARHLYLTQPTISAHVQALEQELNSKLIIRTTKKLTITTRGYQLYDCALQMLNMRNHLVEEFTGKKKKIIDLGASTIPSSYLLPEILGDFGKKNPNIYFHAWQSDSAGVLKRVLEGSVDLGLIGQKTEEESCIFLPFCQDSLVIATPVTEQFLEMKGRDVTFDDFMDFPIIMRENGSGTKKEMDKLLENLGIPFGKLNVIAQMNDLEAIKQSIVKGLGISVMSLRSVKDLAQTKQLLLFSLKEPAHKRTFYIVYSKNRILKPHVRQFIHFVQGYYHFEN